MQNCFLGNETQMVYTIQNKKVTNKREIITHMSHILENLFHNLYLHLFRRHLGVEHDLLKRFYYTF